MYDCRDRREDYYHRGDNYSRENYPRIRNLELKSLENTIVKTYHISRTVPEPKVVFVVSSSSPKPSVSLNKTPGACVKVVKVSPDFKNNQSMSVSTKTSPSLPKEPVKKNMKGVKSKCRKSPSQKE